MSNTLNVNVEGIGEVTMIGTGPWRVRSNNGSSHEIVDADGRVANPTVMQKFSTRGFKPNRNVTWARRDYAQRVVDAANAALEAAAPAETETPVEQTVPNADETTATTATTTTDANSDGHDDTTGEFVEGNQEAANTEETKA